jgi:hypothetical protein
VNQTSVEYISTVLPFVNFGDKPSIERLPWTLPPSSPASQGMQDHQQQVYIAGYLTAGNNVHGTQVALEHPAEVAMLLGQMPPVDQLK